MTPSCWLVSSATVFAIASGVNRRSGAILKYRRHQAGTTVSGVTMCRDLTYKIDAVKPDRAETDRFRAKESPLGRAFALWPR